MTIGRFVFGGLALVALAAGRPTATGQAAPSSTASLTLALTGDSILTRRVSVFKEPEFVSLMAMIRGADAAFTNLETLFHDYEAAPAHESGGTWMRTEPPLIKELTWAGFDIVSRANNHAGDFGVAGQQITSRYVREAGLVEAGVGNSLSEAREAKYFETPHGRVALIAAASTFTPHSRAGNTRGDMPPRPGLSPLRYTTTYIVTPDRLADLKRVAAELSGQPLAAGDALTFGGRRYVAGPTPGTKTAPSPQDVAEIARVVKNAATFADLVIVSLHCHESGSSLAVPADFITAFAHAVVDAGADVVVGHGPHVLRGVEIYKGKPVFYSLANFIFQNDTVTRMPSDSYEEYALGADAQPDDYLTARYDNERRSFPSDAEYWDSVLATTTWDGRRLVEVALHPITLGFRTPRGTRGVPRLASPAEATRILTMMTTRSKAFGTTVTVKDGVGYIQ